MRLQICVRSRLILCGAYHPHGARLNGVINERVRKIGDERDERLEAEVDGRAGRRRSESRGQAQTIATLKHLWGSAERGIRGMHGRKRMMLWRCAGRSFRPNKNERVRGWSRARCLLDCRRVWKLVVVWRVKVEVKQDQGDLNPSRVTLLQVAQCLRHAARATCARLEARHKSGR